MLVLWFVLVAAQPNESERLVRWARERMQDSEYLVLTFVDDLYVDVLLNQLVAMVRLDEQLPMRVGTVCTDESSVRWLRDFRAPDCFVANFAELHNEDGSLNVFNLWLFRIRILRTLIEHDISVLMTDADAIWQRDPRPDIQLYANANVIAQRAKYPLYLADLWGSTMCMGFAFFRAGPATKLFVRAAQDLVVSLVDDQVAVNRVLNETFGVRFDGPTAYSNSTTYDVGHGTHDFSVVLLPEMRYVRYNCKEKLKSGAMRRAIIVHCANDKRAGTKLHVFQWTGVLYVNQGNITVGPTWREQVRRRLVYSADTFSRRISALQNPP